MTDLNFSLRYKHGILPSINYELISNVRVEIVDLQQIIVHDSLN